MIRATIVVFAMLLPARAAEVLRVGLFPNVTHAQGLVAAHMTRTGSGWFEPRLGGDVRIEWLVYNAGPSAMEALFTKSISFTYVGPSPVVNAYARANGGTIRVASGAMQGGSALVVRRGVIRSADDLRGRLVATPQLGNTQDVECRVWLIRKGFKVTLTGGDVRVVPTLNPDILTLFQKGTLDAAWTIEPWVSRLVDAGGEVLYTEDHAVTTVLATREDLVRDKPVLVERFTAAHRELTEWVLAHPEEAQDMVRAELEAITRRPISPDLIRQSWSRLHPSNAISVVPFDQFLADARLAGLLRLTVNLDKLVLPQP